MFFFTNWFTLHFLFMTNFKSLRPVLAILLAIVVFTPACKDPELIGLEVLPEGEGYPVAWVDTFTVTVSTIAEDSIITSGLTSYLIGEMNDPDFGISKSELFTQFRLPSTNVSFPNAPQIDSIVLNLAYAGSYGTVNKLSGFQRLGVYRLEDDINDTITYYSNVTHNYNTVPLAQIGFRPDLISNVVTNDDTIPPSLRIRLDPGFGQEILNSTSTTLADNAAFVAAFKGLAIIPENSGLAPGQGAILYFNMVSSVTRVELYYTDTAPKSLFLPVDVSSATHTRFTHEYPSSITSILGDTAAGKNQLYMQAMAGLKVKVEIPYLNNLRNLGTVAINRAELVIPLADNDFSRYVPPISLQATGVDSANNSRFLIDFFEITGHYGGDYRSTTKDYVFNVARHLQSILNNPITEPDYGLFILNSGNAVNARRGIFNGTAHAERAFKLRLTYTVIE
jgi:hypothetical protein